MVVVNQITASANISIEIGERKLVSVAYNVVHRSFVLETRNCWVRRMRFAIESGGKTF